MPLSALPAFLDWANDKQAIQDWTGTSDDTLHMTTGLLILTLAALLLRRAPWTIRPWLAVLAAETLNEIHDLLSAPSLQDKGEWADSWHDFWLTLLWPTVVLLLWRRWAPPPPLSEAPRTTPESPFANGL